MTPRILLFTGKGGVGKTTTAAATALRCADAGHRTLVLSTDPAHSLADAFAVELGSDPTPILDHLSGQELDAQERMEESWGDIQAYLMQVFDWAGLDAIEAEELAVFPGLDEIFSLSDIKTHAASGAWDVIVVDCAPTAETIRFLSLPDILAWYMDRLFPMTRRMNKAVAPVLKRITSLPVADDTVFAASRRFYDRLDGVRELLTDPDVTSVRLVVNPERMVIAEARRTYTYLSLFGYRVDAVVANRLLPDDITDPWFAALARAARRTPRDHRVELRAAPDPSGRARGRRARRARSPARVRRRRVRRKGCGRVTPRGRDAQGHPSRGRIPPDIAASLRAPRRSRGRAPRRRIAVRVGPYRRALLLPDSLRRRVITDASLRQGRLRVVFAGDQPQASAASGQGRSRARG